MTSISGSGDIPAPKGVQQVGNQQDICPVTN